MKYRTKRFEILIKDCLLNNKNYSEIYSFVIAFTHVQHKFKKIYNARATSWSNSVLYNFVPCLYCFTQTQRHKLLAELK